MTAPVLVTGGTGTLGRLVVPRLQAAGCAVRVVSRHGAPPGGEIEHVVGDLDTGEGVGAALGGIETVVHLAGSAKGDEIKARHLMRAATSAGARHVVFISVVGADRVPLGYFRAKHDAERLVAASGVPWTTLRATQLHDLILKVGRTLTKLPVVPVPVVRFQPVDAAEVADRLVELALGPPEGHVGDFGGPHVSTFHELIRTYVRVTGRHRLLLPAPLPGRAGRAFRAGANLAPDRALGHRTWEEFLAERLASPRSITTARAS